MAKAELNQSLFASDLSNLPHLNGPLPPKRSRLSLRRTTQILHKPCYKEDDNSEIKHEFPKRSGGDKSNVEMIDLTQDENTSPNCISSVEPKSSCLETDEENRVKGWALGLPNCGNTCFVNSILQVLRFTPDFLNSLHSLLLIHHHLSKLPLEDVETKELIFFKQLHLLYSAMKRKEALMKINADKDYSTFLLKPVKLVIDSLREVSLLFEEGEQHDAHELLLTTIAAFSTACQSLKKCVKNESTDLFIKESSPMLDSNCLSSDIKSEPSRIMDVKHETSTNCDTSAGQELKNQTATTKRRSKSRNVTLDYSVFDNLNLGFEGRIRHVVQCLECEKRLEREESFVNLELNIPEEADNEDDSEPDCPARESDTVDLCDCLSQTTILCGENKYFCEDCQHHNEARMSSEVINPPPILLLHFSWSRTKEINNAEKSTVKVMIPMTLKTSDNSEVFCCSDQDYKLFAVVLHIGRSTEGGHYVSFIKDASQDTPQEDNDQKPMRPKLRPTTQFTFEPENCCSTEEISNFRGTDTMTKWLLFDDSVVLPVIINENSETFPYYDYLSITASPCMIFYHKT